ncbi:MAG: hypothetical protein WBL44_12650 [Nitrososphaeraceae archaeon]|jgi:hypothetical protein
MRYPSFFNNLCTQEASEIDERVRSVDVLGIMFRSLGSARVVIPQVRDGEVFREHGKVYS